MPKKQKHTLKHKIKSRVQGYVAVGRARANQYMAARPHRSFRPTPRERYKRGKKVEKLWGLVTGTFKMLWQEKRLMIPLVILYAVVVFIFVGGVSQFQFVELRKSLNDLFAGNLGALGSTTALFSTAVTGGLNPSIGQLQQFLAGFITFIFWLAIAWVWRRRMSDQQTSIKEALYNCGGPIVPSAMILFVIFLQLIPAAFALFGAALVLSGLWVSSGGVESMVVTAAAALMILISLYWITASFMALIIVALPGMSPWRAHAAASALVVGQRWRIALRLLSIVVVAFLVWFVVLIPTLLIDGWLKFDWLPLIPVVVHLLGAFTVVYAATYLYRMYRSML